MLRFILGREGSNVLYRTVVAVLSVLYARTRFPASVHLYFLTFDDDDYKYKSIMTIASISTEHKKHNSEVTFMRVMHYFLSRKPKKKIISQVDTFS